jgi:hypothetical protein
VSNRRTEPPKRVHSPSASPLSGYRSPVASGADAPSRPIARAGWALRVPPGRPVRQDDRPSGGVSPRIQRRRKYQSKHRLHRGQQPQRAGRLHLLPEPVV